MEKRSLFTEHDMRETAVDAKVGLLSTLSDADTPHVTLITTMEAASPDTLTWGQFSEGMSKENLRRDPRAGFLIMTMDRRIWRGTCRFREAAGEGPLFEHYNRKPMFRYNSYFGIHSVHSMDLLSCRGPEPLGLRLMLLGHGALATVTAVAGAGATTRGWLRRLADGLPPSPAQDAPLNRWTRNLLLRPDTVKFASFVDSGGYPRLVPGVPSLPAGPGRLLLAATVQGDDSQAMRPGRKVAIFALSQKLESVLVRGTVKRSRGLGLTRDAEMRLCTLEVDFVYNTMPPTPGPIYPRPPLEQAS